MPFFFYRKCVFTVFVSVFSFVEYFCCCVFIIGACNYAPARETKHFMGAGY